MIKLTAPSGEKMKFKIRFNTAHGETDLYWRIIIGDNEYLVSSVQCDVPTFSDASFDERANTVKYHIAGFCTDFCTDNSNKGF